MFKLGNILLLIAVAMILLVGGGIIANIIPKDSPIVAPSTVMPLLFVGVGASLKKKNRNAGN